VEHGLASVSVVHPRAVLADAWATALNVLGPEEGADLAQAEGISAFFILRTPAGDFATRAVGAFPEVQGDGLDERREGTSAPLD
jgi:thiamine biosynthesis lipoprotein